METATIPAVSEIIAGKVELATAAEVTTGRDNTRAATPAAIAGAGIVPVAAASETPIGKVELATAAEVTTGIDNTRAATPAAIAGAGIAPVAAASETVAGKVELATAAEVTTGIDNTRAATPKAIKDAGIVAVGSAWSDVTGSRSSGSTYTNNTGRPLFISGWATSTAGSAQTMSAKITIAGVDVFLNENYSVNTSSDVAFFGVVPPGATYVVTSAGTVGASLTKWFEL